MNTLFSLDGESPRIDPAAWVAPGARLMGKVTLAARASVWFNAVLRGDNERITLDEGANVQDGSVLHTDIGAPLTIGRNCTIGHMAILHGCVIGEQALIGMGATVLNHARIGARSLVGAGALVTEGKDFPEGVLIVGRPAKVVRDLTAAEIEGLLRSAEGYQRNAARYRAGLRALD